MGADNTFKRATQLREAGNLSAIQKLFAGGDAAIKKNVLNGLAGKAGGGPEVGEGIIALAVEGAGHPSPMVRYWAAKVIQEQGAYRVDVTPAHTALLELLADPEPEVRRMAAYAVGNVCKQRLDWTRHFAALRQLVQDKSLYVPEAAARALANLSRARLDIGPAVPDLVRVLSEGDDYDEPRKEAAKALLHHARKSPEGRKQVHRAVQGTALDPGRREVRRFLEQLGDL